MEPRCDRNSSFEPKIVAKRAPRSVIQDAPERTPEYVGLRFS